MASPLQALTHINTYPWFVVQKKKEPSFKFWFFFFFFHQLLCLIAHYRLRLTVYILCYVRSVIPTAKARRIFLFLQLYSSVINRLRRLWSEYSRLPCCKMMCYAPEIDVFSNINRIYIYIYMNLLRLSMTFRRRPSSFMSLAIRSHFINICSCSMYDLRISVLCEIMLTETVHSFVTHDG